MQQKHTPAPAPAIDERIASALGASNMSSADLSALINAAEAAAADADAAAERERANALDPARVVDAAAVGSALTAANLTRDRMRAAIPRLQQLHDQARSREYAARWALQCAEAERQRDAAAAMLRDRYPALVGEIVTIMRHLAAADAAVNRGAPDCARRLESVERHVRGELFQPDVSTPEQLRLPVLDRRGGPVFAWPPAHQVSAAAATAAAVAQHVAASTFHPGGSWQDFPDEQDRLRREEERRVSEYYEKQRREADARREAEHKRLVEERMRQGHM